MLMKAAKNNSKTKSKRVVKRNIKDSVFTDLFKIKKYSLELYKSLHPEDKDVTVKDLKIYTNKPVLVNDLYNDFAMGVKEYFNNKAPIDLKVNVILKAEKNSILYQYIEFSRITDTLIKKNGYKKATAEKIVNSCIKKNILKEYLTSRKKEVVDIMGILFDQDIITRNYENEIFEEGKAEGKAEGMQQGMQEGMQQGKVSILVKQFKDKKLSAQEGADYLSITVNEFLELAK